LKLRAGRGKVDGGEQLFFLFFIRERKNSATVSGSGFAIAGTHWAAPVEQPGELGGLVFIGLAHLF
jgi:hypothetical protein